MMALSVRNKRSPIIVGFLHFRFGNDFKLVLSQQEVINAVNKMIADYETTKKEEDGVYYDVYRMLLMEKDAAVKHGKQYFLYVARLFNEDQSQIEHMYDNSLTLEEMHAIYK